MDTTLDYLHYDIQEGENEAFGVFGAEAAQSHGQFPQTLEAAAYDETFALRSPPLSSNNFPGHSTAFTFIPRELDASQSNHHASSAAYPIATKFESPRLSSGSSSTPETNESHLLVPSNTMSSFGHLANGAGNDLGGYTDGSMAAPQATRKRSGKNHTTEPFGLDPEEVKRRQFLLRNRVAAMKCRKKRKEWVTDLEDTKLGLESQNSHLHLELDGLMEEASRIRAQLMAHANCNDVNIDKWIENEAKRFVIGTSDRYDQILATFGPTPGLGGRHDSSSSASDHHLAGGPSLVSPMQTPSLHCRAPTPHGSHSHVTPSPSFFDPNTGMHATGTHGMSVRASPFSPDDGTDYDGMPIALYDPSTH
ncbi:hypothetical protein GGR57DRAFT_203294 [Xylariaceae sp. FL1272]|nr:hypothetical protein GGR57DRAFT_203294 [Xylariaceae sp. FL1272]